jgi:Raf kinase inhibitor-like YbhB/YbcL family protein
MGFALSDLQLTSPAFQTGASIPSKFTGEGVDVSPELNWTNVPDGTSAFAVICHDPDAPLITPRTYGYVHWVLYNIPSDVRSLAEGMDQFTSGNSDFGNPGYGGPMPPNGHGLHHYFFWLLALDTDAALPAGLTMWDLLDKVEPNVIGMNRLVGTYQRD